MKFGIVMRTDTPAVTGSSGFKAQTPLLLVVRIAKLRLVARLVKKNIQELAGRALPIYVVMVQLTRIAVRFAMVNTPSGVLQMNLAKSSLVATPGACAIMPIPRKRRILGMVSVRI
jgi:hypothetical protein